VCTGDRDDVDTSAGGVHDLLRRRAELPDNHPGRATLRARAIEAGLPMARRLASAWRGRGEPLDDLQQVAALALVSAVDRYDPTRQVAFSSYAVPTISGAIKRHFRDYGWRMRVPRRTKELAVRLADTGAALAQELDRSPTRHEIATRLGVTGQEVDTAQDAWHAYRPESADAVATTAREDPYPLIETIGQVDPRLDTVSDRCSLQPLLASLTARQQRILAMRYYGDMSQEEIAGKIGVSQAQISRILIRTLAQLRAGVMGRDPATS
jgi:RNA polymerase sigma-B factor